MQSVFFNSQFWEDVTVYNCKRANSQLSESSLGMKKLIIELIKKYFSQITESWVEKLQHEFGNKLSKSQLTTFVESTLTTLLEVIDTSDYTIADQYLIDSYQLFSNKKFNLLQISQLFTIGRYSMLNFLENDEDYEFDPVILLGFLDEVIEQIYARYGMLHQNAELQELASDRDRLATKLDSSQQYLDNILHSSDSAIMVVDKEEKFISWNKGAESIFGYTEDQVLGKPSSLLFPKGRKYIEELKYIQEQINDKGYISISDTERITKDGRIVTIQLNVTKLPGANGESSGRTVIIRDYTEVKRLQQQVDQSEKLAVIGQLAAGVAHEIGNPLTSISSIVQLLQRKAPDDFYSDQLATIKENIDRISRIVRELVDFSRPPSHEKTLIHITDIIKTAIGIVKYDKRVKKVDFNTNLDTEVPPIMLVPDQLLQVFVNILINALDAIDGTGELKIESKHNDDFIYVTIKDNGCGMDEETINKIFDPFFTTKGVGKGTGLGLSVSYGIIKKFKGDISVKSELNKGSTFTVKLPIEEK